VANKDFQIIRYIDLMCGDCVIRVETWRPTGENTAWGTDGWIYVDFMSNGQAIWSRSFKGRIKTAWGILKGHGIFGFEMFSRDEVQAVIDALEGSQKEAFPALITGTKISKEDT